VGEATIHPTPFTLWITIVIHSVLLSFSFSFSCFWIFVMIFFQIYFCWFYLLKLRLLRIYLRNLLLFILPLYKVSMVYEFAKVTQVVLVYEFGGLSFFLFLIELNFFIIYFFSHIVRKIVLEKSHVIKLYKVTKIKGCEETIVYSYIYCTVNDNSNPQCFAFFLFSLCFWIFVMIFFSNCFLSISSFNIRIVENLVL
jgi:hypothetical protein